MGRNRSEALLRRSEATASQRRATLLAPSSPPKDDTSGEGGRTSK